MNGNNVRAWFFEWWKDLFTNAQKGEIWTQYKTTFDSLNNADDVEILQIAEQQLNSILMGNSLTSAQRALLSSRIEFEYKHQKRKSSFARIANSNLNNIVDSSFHDRIKSEDLENNLITYYTWEEYPMVIYTIDNYSYLSIGRLKAFNGVRGDNMGFDEWKIWHDFFGKANILSHDDMINLLPKPVL